MAFSSLALRLGCLKARKLEGQEAKNFNWTQIFIDEHRYQVAIFQINGSMYDYLLAWEDLPLCGSDKDYQDMIVKVRVNPVPEPASMLLLGSGLIVLAGIGRRKILKKKK